MVLHRFDVQGHRPLQDLINTDEQALPLIQEWVGKAIRRVEMLPPSPAHDEALLQTQVTTRSPMGAVVYETGGILTDHGWLRVLGSGHDRLRRTLPGWNEGRSDGFCLVADDAVGGFFALNGGTLGADLKNLYYFAPDSLNWEPLGMGYSDFLFWACTGKLSEFYRWIRWAGWEADVTKLHRCYFFAPPLFTVEGGGGSGGRGEVPVHESWGIQMEFRKQLGSADQG
jgi:hypothetical protein